MGTQVCWKGSCTGSICQKYDLEECFLTAKRGAKADEMCEVACQRRNQPDTCRRTSEIVIMKNISGLKLRPGSPCNDFQGYCDVFQRCRPVDAEGPLARLKNLLFNKKTLISIKQWVTVSELVNSITVLSTLLTSTHHLPHLNEHNDHHRRRNSSGGGREGGTHSATLCC